MIVVVQSEASLLEPVGLWQTIGRLEIPRQQNPTIRNSHANGAHIAYELVQGALVGIHRTSCVSKLLVLACLTCTADIYRDNRHAS